MYNPNQPQRPLPPPPQKPPDPYANLPQGGMPYQPPPNPFDPASPERVIGIWRRSYYSPGFWLRFIFTASLWYWIFWQRNTITLTNRRLSQYKAQILGGTEISINLPNISEVRLETPPLGALLGFATLHCQSFGGGDTAEIHFESIERPEELKRHIFGLQDQAKRSGQFQ